MLFYPRLKRRTVLLGAGLCALAAARGAGASASDPLGSLGSWLDTLIPADESPSATAVGVLEALTAQARTETGALAFLEAGCRWLDSEAQRRGVANFAALDEPTRDAIAHATAVAAVGTAQRQFFDLTWRSATAYYYAHPEAWLSLAYDGPPQPRGFPDANQKP